MGIIDDSLVFERAPLGVDAPELATSESWAAASPDRQRSIADAVVEELRSRIQTECAVELASFGGPPIAIITCGAQSLCLVPGGSFEMGFSEEEEAAVRARAEENDGRTNQYELYWSLLENPHLLRPLTTVHIAPLLAARGPGEMYEIDTACDVLASSKLRLPSEAEWEYLARGGKRRALTYVGDYVPDDPSDYLHITALAAEGANAFGLWGFGIGPELCADVYSPTHDGAALDGSPRRGPGPRVTRGGAGQLFMWQDTGEWQLLLNAMRGSSATWKYEIALRFVLGIQCA